MSELISFIAIVSFVAAVFGLFRYRSRLPAFAGLSGGIMSSSKARNGAVAALVAIAIIGAALVYWGSTAITEFGTTYWMWILGTLVVIYLVLKEQGIIRALVGTVLVFGTIAAITIGTYSQLTTGSVIPSGCSDEPILIQAPMHNFELKQGCVATLDLSLLAQKVHEETKNPNSTINPKVERDRAANPTSVTKAEESQIITALSVPKYKGQRLVWQIKADDDLQRFGVKHVNLKVFTLETSKSESVAKALFGEF